MATMSTQATSAGKFVLRMWANQQCTLMALQRAVLFGFISQIEYEAAIQANPPVDPDDPNSVSQKSSI